MSEPNLTDVAQGDELADLPENVKLDEGEVVLYKYLCSIRFFCVLKIIVFALFMWPPCALFLESRTLMKIGWVIFVIALLVSIYYEVMNFIHEGFYVTNKHLITYNGRKINLFLRSSFPPSYSINFYENKSKFLQDCSWSNKSDDLDGFV